MENAYSEKIYELACCIEDYLDSGIKQMHPEFVPAPSLKDTSVMMNDLVQEVAQCTSCGLHAQRTNTVPGTGALNPIVLVVGEGPGKDEDESGEPFVGKAGQYLDTWLEAIGLSRTVNCYIANVVKCRPPQNRDPQPDEKEACMPYLLRQLDMLNPKAILCLGRIAAQQLLSSEEGIGKLRKKENSYRGIPVVATYHPSAVLRDESLKRPVWENLKTLKNIISPYL